MTKSHLGSILTACALLALRLQVTHAEKTACGRECTTSVADWGTKNFTDSFLRRLDSSWPLQQPEQSHLVLSICG